MTRKSDKAKFVFLMLYFLILTIERIISLATVLTSDIAGYDLLDLYMSVLTAAAIIGAYSYMFLKVRFTAKPRSSDKPEQSVFGKLAIAAGILLLGGMVHTDGTIPPIQFAAYGMILISMAIHTAQRVKALGGGVIRWLSFGYIVAFSMSIPVVYHTSIELMLRGFYEGDGEYQFPAAPFCAAVVGDAAVLMLRWNEEINFFVLIFICVTAVLFIAGKIAGSART